MPEFGIEAQEKLNQSKVLVIGAGGLGSPVLQYLTAAGVGTIGIIDGDKVSLSNLQRQVLFNEEDIGKLKVDVAVQKLQQSNSEVNFISYPFYLDNENARPIIKEYNLIIDGTDSFESKYLINDACVLENKAFVYASVLKFEAQISTFNYRKTDGVAGPNYRDLYPEPPASGTVQNCATAGVLGALVGYIGSLQALEAIKILAEIGDNLSGKLLLIDAFNNSTLKLTVKKDPSNPLTGDNPSQFDLVDYQKFCTSNEDLKQLREISVSELKSMFDEEQQFKLIDVREPFEFDIVHLDAELIPMAEVELKKAAFISDTKVIVYCRSGYRSAKAIEYLQEKYGYKNLYNLKGGIIAYAKEIDPDLATY